MVAPKRGTWKRAWKRGYVVRTIRRGLALKRFMGGRRAVGGGKAATASALAARNKETIEQVEDEATVLREEMSKENTEDRSLIGLMVQVRALLARQRMSPKLISLLKTSLRVLRDIQKMDRSEFKHGYFIKHADEHLAKLDSYIERDAVKSRAEIKKMLQDLHSVQVTTAGGGFRNTGNAATPAQIRKLDAEIESQVDGIISVVRTGKQWQRDIKTRANTMGNLIERTIRTYIPRVVDAIELAYAASSEVKKERKKINAKLKAAKKAKDVYAQQIAQKKLGEISTPEKYAIQKVDIAMRIIDNEMIPALAQEQAMLDVQIQGLKTMNEEYEKIIQYATSADKWTDYLEKIMAGELRTITMST